MIKYRNKIYNLYLHQIKDKVYLHWISLIAFGGWNFGCLLDTINFYYGFFLSITTYSYLNMLLSNHNSLSFDCDFARFLRQKVAYVTHLTLQNIT